MSSGQRFRKYLVAAVPILVLLVFFAYLWFVSGVLPVRDHYSNGREKTVGYVKRSGFGIYRRQGHWITYYPNGRKASEGEYEKGQKIGSWSYWSEDGDRLTSPPDMSEFSQPDRPRSSQNTPTRNISDRKPKIRGRH